MVYPVLFLYHTPSPPWHVAALLLYNTVVSIQHLWSCVVFIPHFIWPVMLLHSFFGVPGRVLFLRNSLVSLSPLLNRLHQSCADFTMWNKLQRFHIVEWRRKCLKKRHFISWYLKSITYDSFSLSNCYPLLSRPIGPFHNVQFNSKTLYRLSQPFSFIPLCWYVQATNSIFLVLTLIHIEPMSYDFSLYSTIWNKCKT